MTEVLANRGGFCPPGEAHWFYLLRQCREHSWRRRQKLASFASRADWEEHCRSVGERFRAALGPMPDRTPLHSQCTGALERDGYVVEKLVIESQPNFYVTANLYRPPEVQEPAPAILNPVGHWADSKAEGVVQARGIGLARRGYVALIYDPLGQGERSQYWDTETDSDPIPVSTSQHASVSNPCYLIGQTVINHMVWDGVRMLDYLETRPEVDAGRIGCTGASGGGTYTMFTTAFDPRIRAAVPVCAISSYERLLSEERIGEQCQNPAATYRDDLDMADLLMCTAPTAVQIIVTTYDFFPLVGAREVYLDLKNCYSGLGIPLRANLVEEPAHHDYNKTMREAMYAWFDRWLEHDGGDAAEPTYSPERPEDLWCTETGQVLTSLGGETVISLNRARSRSVSAPSGPLKTAADAERSRKRVLSAVPEVLGYAGRPAFSEATSLRESSVDGLKVEEVVFETAADLPVPGLVFHPSGAGPHPTLLLIHDRGKGTEEGPDGLMPALARAGHLVIAIDLRGWGETAWRRKVAYESDDFGLLGSDSMLANVCYLLGTWALTQRVSDTIRALDVFGGRDDVDASRLRVVGRGVGALVAYHAAALDSRIMCVAVYEVLASYRSIVEADRYTHPVAGFVPGVLAHYDLPDLVGALAPTPVLIANPLDAEGEWLGSDAATDLYDGAARMRGLLGGELTVRAGLSRPQLVDELVAWATCL